MMQVKANIYNFLPKFTKNMQNCAKISAFLMAKDPISTDNDVKLVGPEKWSEDMFSQS